ncbi:hypothetical protein HYQ46_004470 [Verticillium longisporum]|nr:hypothetical protein HYQ46_004470 [Verticillium longisporum]
MTNCVAGAYISAQLAVKLIDLSCSLPRPSTQIQDEAPRGLPPPHPRLSVLRSSRSVLTRFSPSSRARTSTSSSLRAPTSSPPSPRAVLAEAKEEEKEESDDDMGFGLFD